MRDLERRLAEAEAAAAQWRGVAETLVGEGEALFASRRWRLGTLLLRPVEALLRTLGRPLPPAQHAAAWRERADALAAQLAQRQALLRQQAEAGERDVQDALEALWQRAEAGPRETP
jgi:hypothetical protein